MSREALHAELQRLVEARHPRGDMTAMQTLRLGMLKLIEEVGEAVWFIALPGNVAGLMRDAADEARLLFRERDWLHGKEWAELPWSRDRIPEIRTELVDTYIVVSHLSRLVEEITGEPFDLEAEALAKARADVVRP